MSYFKKLNSFFSLKNMLIMFKYSFIRKNNYLKIKLNRNPIKNRKGEKNWGTIFCPFLSVFLSSLKFPATAKPFLLLSIPKSNGEKMSLYNVFLFSATKQRALPCFLALSFVFVFTCYYIFRSPDLWNFFLINLSDFEFLSRILGIFLF